MASLEDLYANIPTAQIAQQLGVDETTAQNAIQSVLPQLLGGLHETAQDPEKEATLNAAVEEPGADAADGHALVNSLFGSDHEQVASALSSGNGGVDSGLVQKLLPLLVPVVIAYLSKNAGGGSAQSNTGGGLVGELLGGILGGAGGQSGAGGALGSILGSVLGGGSAPAPQQQPQQPQQESGGGLLGQVLGGLFNRKK
ncbi:MAG: DUF937 domain-containing protein [Segniliparus sp.]|uniref:DUF937 domain-containing protein n=1 Tax=Segniliparus sp. TaxID=2804064 RepID=UPI003F2A4499